MLTHGYIQPQMPSRVVVLGSSGFIGGAIAQHLEVAGVKTLRLSRNELDLLSSSAQEKLSSLLLSSDVLLVVAAKVPCKTLEMFRDNLAMIETVCLALQRQKVSHLVYISSDAVYKDSVSPLNEASCAQPNSLHGAMHLAREVALRQAFTGPIAFLRPTLVYGHNDPHNGYGPNRFSRLAQSGDDIFLFGQGEEQRDHVYVEDVAKLTLSIIKHRSEGIANAVTGHVVSFRALAEFVIADFKSPSLIKSTPRFGPMPHNGFRPFDNNLLCQAFPDLHFKSWQSGIAETNRQLVALKIPPQ